MTGGSAIINTNSWAVELNGQHELYESDLETKYVHSTYYSNFVKLISWKKSYRKNFYVKASSRNL